jgi:aminoglycoside phosphotransferase (APT) family kinase protein
MMTLVDELDDRGPFPMHHGDLHSENFLVDSTGHNVGVSDRDSDCAGTLAVPWEAFVVYF